MKENIVILWHVDKKNGSQRPEQKLQNQTFFYDSQYQKLYANYTCLFVVFMRNTTDYTLLLL